MSSRARTRKLQWVAVCGATSALLLLVGRVVHDYARATALDRFFAVQVPASHGPDFVLIVVDTLRADHAGLYGYHRNTTPRVDAFFGPGRVYERAYAPVPSTAPSVISMLSGLYPHRHGVRLLCQTIPPDTVTVVDHLRRAGYQTAAVVSNAVLADSACGLGSRFDYYDDFVDEPEPFRETMYERSAARTTDAAYRWLTARRIDGRPYFLWVHYMDPHGPYRPPDDKPTDFTHDVAVPISPDRVPAYAREPELFDGAEYIDRYDEEIAYTDREIGRLLDGLGAQGLLHRTVVIFTSDHGESMMDHDHWFRHEVNVYEDMVRVPLLIHYPGVVAGREAVAVSTIDLMPTILELASLPVPPGLDAVSLLPAPSARSILCEGAAEGGGLWRGLVRGMRKTTVRHGLSNVVRESRAFDLRTDPFELTPLAVSLSDPDLQAVTHIVETDPDPGGRPRGFAQGELPGRRVAPTEDTTMLERLRALGYVGSD